MSHTDTQTQHGVSNIFMIHNDILTVGKYV